MPLRLAPSSAASCEPEPARASVSANPALFSIPRPVLVPASSRRRRQQLGLHNLSRRDGDYVADKADVTGGGIAPPLPRDCLWAELAAAFAGLAAQPGFGRLLALVDLGIKPDRPGQHKDEMADDIGVPVGASARQDEADRDQRNPDRQIEPDNPPHDLPGWRARPGLFCGLLQRPNGGAHLHVVGVSPGNFIVGEEVAAAHIYIDLRIVDARRDDTILL